MVEHTCEQCGRTYYCGVQGCEGGVMGNCSEKCRIEWIRKTKGEAAAKANILSPLLTEAMDEYRNRLNEEGARQEP